MSGERKNILLALLFLVLIGFWATAFMYVANSALPYNTLRLPFQDRLFERKLKMVLPEGFGFFTRNPRESRFLAYRIQNQELIKLNQTNFSMDTFFGLRRSSRAFNLELGLLLDQVGQDKWLTCEDSLSVCVEQNGIAHIELDNFNPSPFLCGDLVLQKKAPIPWAWAKNFNREMPSQFILVKIKCP